MTADTITAIKKALEGVNAAFLRVLSEAPTDAAHYSIGLDLEGSAIRITLEDMRAIASIPATLESLQRENEGLRNLADRLKLEAQGHAMEARGANFTIAEIYQIISGARGEPGNWNGAEPVRRYVSQLMIDASNHAADAETVRRERDAAEAEANRIKDVFGVEILPRLHLTRVFAVDMTERNWADKKDYIIQQVDWALIAVAALSAQVQDVAGSEENRMRRMIERRDEFIIGKGLWDAFMELVHEAG